MTFQKHLVHTLFGRPTRLAPGASLSRQRGVDREPEGASRSLSDRPPFTSGSVLRPRKLAERSQAFWFRSGLTVEIARLASLAAGRFSRSKYEITGEEPGEK